jgi:alkylation response protein AidB-like acyl-CoA dehydrogenase
MITSDEIHPMIDHSSPWISKAEALARDVLARHAADVDRQARWPAESVDALKLEGFFGLTVPTDFGGAGEGPRTFAAVLSRLAEGCASTAMIYLMHVCGTQVMSAAAEFGRREQVLRDVAAGVHLSTLAFSEKGSRSHFWAPVSQATADGDGRRLTADKSWVTSADRADGYIVSTRSAGAAEPAATTLYFVPKGASGMTVAGPWTGLGLRGNASAPIRFENVVVAAADRVSGEGSGFDTMLSEVLPWFQVGSAAKLEHLGQSLAALPNLRAELAKMQITADTQAAFLHHVAWKMENPRSDTMLAVLGSKAAATEAALHVTDLAMRACGGTAFSGRLGVERNFRDARAGSVMAPTTDVLYDFVGKAVLGMPLF